MILTLTPNPCVDKTVFVDTLEPGAFIRAARVSCIAGGKGTNVSRAVHALGRPTKALLLVGGHTGEHVVDMVHAEGIECVPIRVASATRTVTTVLEESVHRQTAFFEPGPAVTRDEYDALRETFREALLGAQVVVLCGTVPDLAIERLYAEIIPEANAAGAKVILDSHGPEFRLGVETGPFMVKPNVAEAEEYFEERLDDEAARWRALERFHQKGIVCAVLTMGKDGALVSYEGDRFHVTPPCIEEINSVGSGDAFVGGFATGLLEDMGIQDMLKLAVAAGAANASTWDIGHFSADEVTRLSREATVQIL